MTYNITCMFMLISYFLQAITQKNQNHYQARESMFKVYNKTTKITGRSNHSKVFLKIAIPKILAKPLNNTCEKVISVRAGGCRL